MNITCADMVWFAIGVALDIGIMVAFASIASGGK